jgi:hypothetical protein
MPFDNAREAAAGGVSRRMRTRVRLTVHRGEAFDLRYLLTGFAEADPEERTIRPGRQGGGV